MTHSMLWPNWNSSCCSDIPRSFTVAPFPLVLFFLPNMPFPLPDHLSFHHTVSLFPLTHLFILQSCFKCHLLPRAFLYGSILRSFGSTLYTPLLWHLPHCFVNIILRIFPARWWAPQRKTPIHYWIFLCIWNKGGTGYVCLKQTNRNPAVQTRQTQLIKQQQAVEEPWVMYLGILHGT